jgi:hypothetical protein
MTTVAHRQARKRGLKVRIQANKDRDELILQAYKPGEEGTNGTAATSNGSNGHSGNSKPATKKGTKAGSNGGSGTRSRKQK